MSYKTSYKLVTNAQTSYKNIKTEGQHQPSMFVIHLHLFPAHTSDKIRSMPLHEYEINISHCNSYHQISGSSFSVQHIFHIKQRYVHHPVTH